MNAERSLKTKETKKAREDVRIATTKIETFSTKLSSLRSTELTLDDRRVFPMVYGGVIIKRDGKNWLTPMRYFCRPAGKPAFYDRKFPGLYNARRDNLEKFWSEQFGHRSRDRRRRFVLRMGEGSHEGAPGIGAGRTRTQHRIAIQAQSSALDARRMLMVALD